MSERTVADFMTNMAFDAGREIDALRAKNRELVKALTAMTEERNMWLERHGQLGYKNARLTGERDRMRIALDKISRTLNPARPIAEAALKDGLEEAPCDC